MKKQVVLTILLIFGASGAVFSAAPLDATPFQVTGHIQRFTLDTPGDLLSAAKITVNGTEVVIPRNLIIQMPATFLTAADIFDLAPPNTTQRNAAGACGGPKASGLALDDCPAPLAAFEVSISGNIVDDKHIAGLVNISQQALNLGQGYIQAIDFNTGDAVLYTNHLPGPISIAFDPPVRGLRTQAQINEIPERGGPPIPFKATMTIFDSRERTLKTTTRKGWSDSASDGSAIALELFADGPEIRWVEIVVKGTAPGPHDNDFAINRIDLKT